ncbi:MAG: DUF2062 domain-containing protein [Opitutae bacterium]|nr:DUF2062 domain-containing protein [Opitutae bacterium]
MTAPVTTLARPPFWQRRVVAPLLAQLTQGVTPDKLSATLAVGTACSLFPFLGFTSLLNLGVGVALRMNQPVLQTLNQVLGPLQLVLVVAYLRLGEFLWRDPPMPFSFSGMIGTFGGKTVGEFLAIFGRAGAHAFTAWALTSPLLVAVLFCSLRPVLRRLASSPPARA